MAKQNGKGGGAKAGAKAQKNKKAEWAARVIACLILVAALLVSLIWATDINRAMGLTKVAEEEFDGASRDEALGKDTVVSAGGDLNVHFVDVGQGDACIVEFPDDKKMIIDGGKDKEKEKLLTYIDENIRDREGKKIDSFDYAILTHPDEDHCGGLDDVLEKYPAEVFYRPNVLSSYKDYTDPAAAAITAQSKYGTQTTLAYKRTIEAGYNIGNKNGVTTTTRITDATDDEISVIEPEGVAETAAEYYSVTFYAPVLNYFSDINDYSPVLVLEYHNKRIALSGDAEKDAEADFVQRVESAKTDGKTDKYDVFTETYSVNVLKLGHHGSKTSSSQAYLETLTTPETAKNVLCIVSCALINSYGHPSPETLNRLKGMGFSEQNILSTSSNGSIALSVRAVADVAGGAVTYDLFYGADMVRYEEPTLSAGAVKMQWQEIVYTLIVFIVLILIVAPLITLARKKYKKAVREVKKQTSQTRKRK